MSAFTPAEIEYLASQPLGRLATVGPDGAPHVVPVRFRFNPDTGTIDIGGHRLSRSKKWRDIGREARVAFVVDDVLPRWRPRLIEMRGTAARLEVGLDPVEGGSAAELIRITPTRIVSWGIEAGGSPLDMRVPGRDVTATPPGHTG